MNSETGSFLSVEDPSDEDSRLVVRDNLDGNHFPWVWEPRVGKDVNVWGYIRKGEFSLLYYNVDEK